MGKSIRSKIKRQHRAEFRRTIGTEAYNANMEKLQTKMKDAIDKQTLKSLDRLADALETRDTETLAMQDDNEPEDEAVVDDVVKGENKVIINKRSTRKQKHGYRMKAIVGERKTVTKEKQKPKYHCAF